MLISPSGKLVYVMASLSGTLVNFVRDPETGRLSDPEVVRVTPDDGSLGPASIEVSPDGRIIYAGAQAHESVLLQNQH